MTGLSGHPFPDYFVTSSIHFPYSRRSECRRYRTYPDSSAPQGGESAARIASLGLSARGADTAPNGDHMGNKRPSGRLWPSRRGQKKRRRPTTALRRARQGAPHSRVGRASAARAERREKGPISCAARAGPRASSNAPSGRESRRWTRVEDARSRCSRGCRPPEDRPWFDRRPSRSRPSDRR